MTQKLFIPQKLKVGFQNRDDTYTGKLAYIIYFDEKGKLRKEQSWQSWRNKNIAPEEYDNSPIDGFTLNKDVQRSREWFGSGRNLIRIHDPRGFEFEISCENLIEVLMHTDCLRRGLVGQFVYAWAGTELVLLPTNSEEYQQGSKYTSGLSKKVSAKDLVPGISYKTKKEGDVIFIGRFNWYEYSRKGYPRQGTRQETKALVFTADDGKSFMKKTSADFLSEANSDIPVSNLAELVDKFNSHPYANKIVKWEFRPTTFNPDKTPPKKWYGEELKRRSYFVEAKGTPGVYLERSVGLSNDPQRPYDISDEYSHYQGTSALKDTGELIVVPAQRDRGSYYGYNRTYWTLKDMQAMKFYDLFVTFENGKSKKVKSFYALMEENYTENYD